MSRIIRTADNVVVRPLITQDAPQVMRLARSAGNLDINSLYGYSLLCRDFGSTSVAAVDGARLVAFVLGYRRPANESIYFAWQWAADPAYGATGFTVRVLREVLEVQRPSVRRFETTVRAGSCTGAHIVERLARTYGADVVVREEFGAELLGQEHGAEYLHAFNLVCTGS